MVLDSTEWIGQPQARAKVQQLQRRIYRLEAALQFYANKDAESVKDGILESVYHRPATRVLEEK